MNRDTIDDTTRKGATSTGNLVDAAVPEMVTAITKGTMKLSDLPVPSPVRACADQQTTGAERSRREADFWKWFVKTEAKLRRRDDDPLGVNDRVGRALRKVRPDLICEISYNGDDWEFVVTADGCRDVIPAVESLCAAAPVIDGWRIVKFRQRSSGTSVVTNGITLSVDDIEVAFEANGDKADLIVFVRGLSDSLIAAVGGKTEGLDFLVDGPAGPAYDRDGHLIHAAILLCDHNIGEYDMMTKVGRLMFVPFGVPSQRRRFGLKILPPVLDAFLAS